MKKIFSLLLTAIILIDALPVFAKEVNAPPSPTAAFSKCIGGKSVSLSCRNKSATIYYKLGKGKYKKYKKAFAVSKNTQLYAYSTLSGKKSKIVKFDIYGIEQLNAPKELYAVYINEKQAAISWRYSKNAEGYYIYRSESKKGKYKKIGTVTDRKTIFTDKIKKNKKYYYKVSAYAIGKGTSRLSSAAKASTKHRFRTAELLNEHYNKHGKEMGYDSPEEYLRGANRVINNPSVLKKQEAEDNDYVFYLKETNEIVFMASDGYIRTYYICDDEYFYRQ